MKKVTSPTTTQRLPFQCATRNPRYRKDGPGTDEVGAELNYGKEIGSETTSPSSSGSASDYDGDE